MNEFYAFLAGMVAMGFLVASLFFLRFWAQTRDILFMAFALAFLLLGIGQAWTSLTTMPVEERSPLFLVRLLAFVLIILSIWWKNRAGRRSGAGEG